jgi:hypothetical protein
MLTLLSENKASFAQQVHQYGGGNISCMSFAPFCTSAHIPQYAKELLEKEFPLKIRLLGIRMTHLKDLEGPPGGMDKVSEHYKPPARSNFF